MTDDDHIPVSYSMYVDNLPKLSRNFNDFCGKIDWESISDQNRRMYYECTMKY